MIKRKLIVLLIFTIFTASTSLPALEVNAGFRIENISFKNDRKKSETTFDGLDFPWGLSISGNHAISDKLIMEAGYYNDPILRNISYALFSFKDQYFSVGVGPFLGVFNASTYMPKLGLSTSVELSLPGILFLSFRADNIMTLIQSDDYTQELNEIAFGFYVPNAICSFTILTKEFNDNTALPRIIDKVNRYSLQADVFQKNVPYRLILSFAYENMFRDFVETAITTRHTLNSIIMGTAFDLNIRDNLVFIFDLESSLYTFGQDELLGISSSDKFLFRLYTGVKINLTDYFNNNKGPAL
jgi:hypothetical protein